MHLQFLITFLLDRLSWHDAEKICVTKGMKLPTIESFEDLQMLFDYWRMSQDLVRGQNLIFIGKVITHFACYKEQSAEIYDLDG